MNRATQRLTLIASMLIFAISAAQADTATKEIGSGDNKIKVVAKLSGSEWWACSDDPCFKDDHHQKKGLVTFLKLDGTPLPNNPDNMAPAEAQGVVCGKKNEHRPTTCDPDHPARKCICALVEHDPNATGEAKDVWQFVGSATDNVASGVKPKHEYRCVCITFTKPAGSSGTGGTTKHPKRKHLVKE